jgi:hypothetical protein
MRNAVARFHIGGLSLLALASLGIGTAAAQEMYPEVEYISGHENMEKQKGTLLIGSAEMKFTKKDGTVLFSLPLSGVSEVSSQTEIRDGSVGKKLLFGGLAGSRKQDFIQVTYETDKMAEGLVFKVKQGTSTGIVAKLKFAVKKAKGESPDGASTVSQSIVTQ